MSAPAGETTLYYHNYNWQVLTEYDDANNLQRKFIYGNGTESPQWRIDEVLLMKAGENDYYYAHDHLYSPAALIDSSGTVLERYEYDAYGNCRILEPNFAPDPDGQSDYGNNYLFTGRRVDILDNSSLKIQYNRNRYYDYYTGRWLTHDPVGINPAGGRMNAFLVLWQYGDGLNVYQYLKSNPVKAVDPWAYGEYEIGTDEPPNSYANAITESRAVYNTWPRTWKNWKERTSIKIRTWLNIAGGHAKRLHHAARHLTHFALNSGDDLDIGYPDLIKEDSSSKTHFKKELMDAVNYVEAEKPCGKNIVTIGDYLASTTTKDWFLALGSYRTWAKGEGIECANGKWKMKWTIYFRDVYDWQLGSMAPGGLVVDDEMARMHRYGEMQEYVLTGECTVEVEWEAEKPGTMTYTSCK